MTTFARKLLLVDKDEARRDRLAIDLTTQAKFDVSVALSAADGLARTRSESPDMVVMDGALPDMDGGEAVRRMRSEGFRRPIIVLTEDDSEAERVLHADVGANDFVNKPLRLATLLARLQVQMRQYELRDDTEVSIGQYRFVYSCRQMVCNSGRRIRLTSKEAALLRFLYRARGQVVDRARLLEEVWGYRNSVNTHTLETHVYRLRQKIEAVPTRPSLLLRDTDGYRLAL